MIDKKKCAMPDCQAPAASIGRRGSQSQDPGRSKRSSWCAYHRRGKGKQERLDYVNKIHGKDLE